MNFRPITWVVGLSITVFAGALQGDDTPEAKRGAYGKASNGGPEIMPPEWQKAAKSRTTAAEIDALLSRLHQKDGLLAAPQTSDEQFIRRVTLDVTGKIPSPSTIRSFVSSRAENKRGKLIDELLSSAEFDAHWARYWRDVVTARATEQRVRLNEPNFEAWLTQSVREKRTWSEMVKEMITSSGELRYRGDETSGQRDSGAGYFLLTHTGPDAVNERAADTARVFLGIQIQCAQCHDHPSDVWKRQHFHELAAFYARTKERPIREENRLVGIRLFSAMVGEHRMPDKDDPKKTYTMSPRFLTGEKPPRGLDDRERRSQLAEYVTAPGNYWFFANFVNRTWSEFMGQGFYNPVDNMGPLQEATYPELLLKLAAHFRETGTDIRDLYRVILNTQAYQRQSRLGESAGQHVHFAGNYPSRLSADELWASLANALGGVNAAQRPFAPGPGAPGKRAPGKGEPGKGAPGKPGPADRLLRRFGFEGVFKQAFAYDPSTKQDEVEASIPQALMLMNNPLIQSRLRAQGETVLGQLLRSHTSDADAVQALYLRVLARRPSAREQQISLDHLKRVGKRNEAFEDLHWALLNSAEFQTKR